MKFLSFVLFLGGIACFVLAFLARVFFDGRIIFNFIYYLDAAQFSLLASIALALHYLIGHKEKA